MVAFLRALSICQNSVTRSAIPVVTRISLLIKTIQPDPAIKSWIACTKEIVFQQKLLEKADFIVKMTGPVIVRPANSDFWKAPLVFVMAILELDFGRKKLFDGRGLFGSKIKERQERPPHPPPQKKTIAILAAFLDFYPVFQIMSCRTLRLLPQFLVG